MVIDKFEGKYAFLSNFYASTIKEDGITYPTVEHYFQAHKTLDYQERQKIAAAATPDLSKQAGRHVILRGDWEDVKEQIMLDALHLKFAIPELADKLLATVDARLIEGTVWHDNEWGNCSCEKCINIEGKNKLGKLLMQVREEL